MADPSSNRKLDPPPVLDYGVADPMNPPHPRRWLAFGMALAWVIVAMVAGISGDRISIPTPKKIAITAAASTAVLLMFVTTRVGGQGCAVMFFLYAAITLGVMWFWN